MSLVSFVKVNHTHHDQLTQAIADSLNLIHYHLPIQFQRLSKRWQRATQNFMNAIS